MLDGIATHASDGVDPRFGDDEWDIGSAVFRKNSARSRERLRFDIGLSPEDTLTLKELLYARLHRDVEGVRRAGVGTLRIIVDYFRLVARELPEAGLQLTTLTPDKVATYGAWMRARMKHGGIESRVSVLRMLYYYRNHLTGGGLDFLPFGSDVPRRWGGENATPRIPERVIGPLLQWSLLFIRDFSADILAVIERRRRPYPIESAERPYYRKERIEWYLDRLVAAGDELPVGGLDGGLDVFQIGRELGFYGHGTTTPRREDLERAIVAGARRRNLKVPNSAEKKRLVQIFGPRKQRTDIEDLTLRLEAAALIVVSYLSGMRASEVSALKPDCYSVDEGMRPGTKIHRVESLAFKGESPQGRRETWVVGPEVGEAIGLLRRLRALMPERYGEELFHAGRGFESELAGFMRHLRALEGLDTQAPIPELVDGKVWRINLRQFRRTLAWYIANRPFGHVAGMIQFKHVSVTIFQGYAGSSRSGFAKEVQQEKSLMKIETVFDRYRAWERGAPIIGGGSIKVARMFEQVRDAAGGLPGQVADEARVRTLLHSYAKQLHVALTHLCHFDPTTALCADAAKTLGIDGPVISACIQGRCPNAEISPEYEPAWLDIQRETKRHLQLARKPSRGRQLPVLQIRALQEELDWIDPIVAGLHAAREGKTSSTLTGTKLRVPKGPRQRGAQESRDNRNSRGSPPSLRR